MITFVVLFIAAFCAGVQNALAGGGSFLTFPALMLTGLDARAANITSTVALFPGQITTGFAGRNQVSGLPQLSFKVLFIISLIGGIFGWIITDSIGIALLFCALAIMAILKFPVLTICLVTSLFGSLIICELLLTNENPYVISAIWVSGFAVQMLIKRRQKIFAKIYPDKVTHSLEQKKRKTYADSI